MLNTFTTSIIGDTITISSVLLLTFVALILGVGIACVYMLKNTYNKGFVVTLALLPAMVEIVILLVNGNLGTGIAVMGAFSLVRFRSVPGSAKEISSIFFAMAIGLAAGTGYIFFAVLFFLLIAIAMLVLNLSRFGETKTNMRTLKVTIPETLDYDTLFDDIFAEYTTRTSLERVKTTNMGSLYELTYQIQLKSAVATKEFIDSLRCRNGNLNILLSRPIAAKEEL